MKLFVNTFFSSILILALSGCSSMSSKKTSEFQMRGIQEKTLGNGLRVVYIPDASLPRVSISVMLLSGSAQDPKGSEGLMNMTADLLEQGSTQKSALQLADAFAQLGSSFGNSVAQDYVMISTSGLSTTRTQLAELFAETVLNPAFQNAEVERLRSQVLAQIAQIKDQPSAYADLLYDSEVFSGHPYGNPTMGTAESVKTLNRARIIKNYFAHFRPNNAILAVTGKIDEDFKSRVENLFSSWQKKDLTNVSFPEMKMPTGYQFKMVSKPGLQQAQIRMGHPGIARNNPDFLKVRLANIVLGGAFASRLNQKVRDDLGLTYSISSRFDTMKYTGSFDISTFTRNDKVGETIQSSLNVLREFREKGITDQELDAAKALLIGQFPAAIETVDRLATNLLILRLNGVSDDYLKDFFVNVNSITRKQVNEAIKTYFSADNMKVLVYADEKAVGNQLSQFGTKF